jgi:hypothetical protein
MSNHISSNLLSEFPSELDFIITKRLNLHSRQIITLAFSKQDNDKITKNADGSFIYQGDFFLILLE